MRLGLGILLLALANPLEVAETFASLDVVSGGRITLGVGLGYRDVEYDAFGIARHERVRRFEENLRMLEALWAGEAVSAELAWCRPDGATLTILPVQRPRPPLWMAADGDRAVERAARMADTWIINPHTTSSTIARQLQLFEAGGMAEPSAGRRTTATHPRTASRRNRAAVGVGCQWPGRA
jgi:alkanesulfonate monooxygenase SsuD/methylene tetrahydromethanopterin reductase-like flavin-dependent oxidoreductase (luciferase family)